MQQVPAGWRWPLAAEVVQPYFRTLEQFLARERRRHTIYPPAREVFNALRLTPLRRTRVVLLGQDPYPGEGQAHGLSFSVNEGVLPPPSLVNIFKELGDDLGCAAPRTGSLARWARQGVLLLNAVLTVRAGQPGSHRGHGWEIFTDAIVRLVSQKRAPVVFVLWGRDAQRKARLIDAMRHAIVTSAHPSPLSARGGFFGSRPFSRINEALRRSGQPEIEWCLEGQRRGGRRARC